MSAVQILPDFKPLSLWTGTASSSDLESSSEVTKSKTGALLILLATLALTTSDMSAVVSGTACRGSADTCLLWVHDLLVSLMAWDKDRLCTLLVSSVTLSALICSTKCSLADNWLDIATNMSIIEFKVGSVSYLLLSPS